MRAYPPILLAAAAAAACSSTEVMTTTGALVVSAAVSGEVTDTIFAVDVSFDGLTDRHDLTTGEALVVTLEEGIYGVELVSVAQNCMVETNNPVEVVIASGFQSDVGFDVVCTLNGDLSVTVTTAGVNIDDMYALVFNTDFRTVLSGPDQIHSLSLPVGAYSIELTEVAANCTVDTPNPVSVDVTVDTSAAASFAVTCVQP